MKTKLFLTSIVAMSVVAPAFATPTNTSATFPANGYMLEDYTYTNAATSTNMAGVYENSVNADANYDNCPANSWCDASGQHACSTAGDGSYTNSAAGATENTACYKACTVDTANIAHATAVSGNDYYGAGVDTCSAATCENGYHIETTDITQMIGTYTGYSGYIEIDDSQRPRASEYGLTQNGEFAVNYNGSGGLLKGRAQCSTQNGTDGGTDPSAYTTSATLPDSTGATCWCTVESYTPLYGATQTFSIPWVAYGEGFLAGASFCANVCAFYCSESLRHGGAHATELAFRAAVLAPLATGTPATCEGNTITINWSNASAADIAANEAGTVTYGGDIRTPRAAEIVPGKVFVGWKFEVPEVQGGGGK